MSSVVDTVTGAVGGLFGGGGGGSDGADASRDAARTQAQAQQNALNYLKKREELPQQFREGALAALGGFYGLEGGDEDAAAAFRDNPIFQATMGNLPAQEEAILRNASATGGLRSGNAQAALAENQRRNEISAYQNTLSGLSGLANLPSNAGQIAQQTANIGQTQAQGIIGAAQSQQASNQAGFGNLMGLGQLGLSAFAAFCDPRLKNNADKIGEYDGVSIYEWDWNEKAEKLGLTGKGYGPMADEIKAIWPDRIEQRNGYMYVRAA